MNKKELTIVIPTYNRFEQLCRQLRSLSVQGNYDKYYLVLLDNHSDYSLKDEIDKAGFDSKFLNNIEIVERPINTRIGYNTGSLFLYNKTKWMYAMSDDDICTDDQLETLFSYIHKYPNASWIKFAIGLYNRHEDIVIKSVKEFQKCYDSKKFISGDIFYIGNNLINTEILSDYLADSFEFCSCLLGFIMTFFHHLVAGNANIILSDKHVQKFVNNTNGDSWHGLPSLLKFAQNYDVRWENPNETKQLLRMVYLHFSVFEVTSMLLKENDFHYQRYAYKRLRSTLFDKRMNVSNALVFLMYNIECFTKIPLITGGFEFFMRKKKELRQRLKKNTFAREWYRKKYGHYPME